MNRLWEKGCCNMPKEFFLTIESYVYFNCVGKDVVFYNSLTGDIFSFQDRNFSYLIKRLMKPYRLRVIKISCHDLSENIKKIISFLRKRFLVDLIPCENIKHRFFQVATGYEEVAKHAAFNVWRSSPVDLVSKCTIVVSQQCEQHCPNCLSYQKNCSFCLKRNGHDLPWDIFVSLVNTIKNNNPEILILGGDIFLYRYLKQTAVFLKEAGLIATYGNHYLNFYKHLKRMPLVLPKSAQLKIFVSFPLEEKKLYEVISYCEKNKILYSISFLVRSLADLRKARWMKKHFCLENKAEFYADAINADQILFSREVYLTKKVLSGLKPTLRTIYARKEINTDDFGNIFLFPDKSLYANINQKRIGFFNKNNLKELLSKELKKRNSWRKVRCLVKPCKKCVYNCLCPSLSSYEYLLKKNNLCYLL